MASTGSDDTSSWFIHEVLRGGPGLSSNPKGHPCHPPTVPSKITLENWDEAVLKPLTPAGTCCFAFLDPA